MLSTIAFVIALAAGANAQCEAPNGAPYDFCGSVAGGEFNLYWNYRNESQTLSLLYSALTPGWHAFGFPVEGVTAPPNIMPGASVVPGCIDFVGVHEINANNASSADWLITARDPAGITAGASRQNLTEYQVGETDGYCWVRFVRSFMAIEVAGDVQPQDITGESQLVTFAWGPEVFTQHTGRGATMINFADGTGVEAVAARPPLGGDDDGSASALSMAAVVPALVAAVAALL